MSQTSGFVRHCKISGLKMSKATLKLLFDKSCSFLTPLSAPQVHIRGARVTVMRLIVLLFCAAYCDSSV